MKKILCVLVCVLAAGIAWGQEEFPHPTMEMVNFAPATWVGTTVIFEKARIDTDYRKWTEFGNVIYTFFVTSKNGEYYKELHYSGGVSASFEEINFYTTQKFTGELLYVPLTGVHTANLTCVVEQLTWTYGKEVYPCWMCKVIKIEELDKDVNIIETYTETGAPLPTNPCEAGILSERNRWDVGGDNVMGLPEAIRALQIAVQK